LTAAGIAAVLLLFSTAEALAHASLIAAEPTDRSVVASPPRELRLTFNEPVTPLVMKLVSSHAPMVFLGSSKVDGSSVVVEAPADMTPGTYAFSWRVISVDGHPVAGTIVFSIGSPSPGLPPQADEAYDPPARAALWVVRLAIYLGLFIGVGGAFASRWLAPSGTGYRDRSPITRCALMVGLAAVPLSVGLQGLDALGAQLRQLSSPIVWATGFDTSWGTAAIAAGIALLAGLCAIWARRRPLALGFGFAGLIGIGWALAASGHASAASPQGLTGAAVALHGVGIALWIGSLLPLAAAMKREGSEALTALRRFSSTIPVVLAAVVLSGGLLAVIQVERIEALWSTAYGRVLVGKLALMAALLAIVAWNRFALTPRIYQGRTEARHGLVRTIAAELVLATVVFMLVATWRFTPPPRALAVAAAQPVVLSFHTASAFAKVAFSPARAGPVKVSMLIMTGNFEPLNAKAVTLTVANPAIGVEPITRPAHRRDDGSWRIDVLTIPLPGRWSARVDIVMPDDTIVTPDDTIVTLEDQLDIRP
jgi:copper transport protein